MVEWKFANRYNITIQAIKAVEEKIAIKFPSDYIEHVLKYDGGSPIPQSVRDIGSINNLFSFSKDSKEYIAAEYRLFKKDVIAFAKDAFGNLFCFDFREEPIKIVFLDLDMFESVDGQEEVEYNLTYVCNTFTELLNMIHVD